MSQDESNYTLNEVINEEPHHLELQTFHRQYHQQKHHLPNKTRQKYGVAVGGGAVRGKRRVSVPLSRQNTDVGCRSTTSSEEAETSFVDVGAAANLAADGGRSHRDLYGLGDDDDDDHDDCRKWVDDDFLKTGTEKGAGETKRRKSVTICLSNDDGSPCKRHQQQALQQLQQQQKKHPSPPSPPRLLLLPPSPHAGEMPLRSPPIPRAVLKGALKSEEVVIVINHADKEDIDEREGEEEDQKGDEKKEEEKEQAPENPDKKEPEVELEEYLPADSQNQLLSSEELLKLDGSYESRKDDGVATESATSTSSPAPSSPSPPLLPAASLPLLTRSDCDHAAEDSEACRSRSSTLVPSPIHPIPTLTQLGGEIDSASVVAAPTASPSNYFSALTSPIQDFSDHNDNENDDDDDEDGHGRAMSAMTTVTATITTPLLATSPAPMERPRADSSTSSIFFDTSPLLPALRGEEGEGGALKGEEEGEEGEEVEAERKEEEAEGKRGEEDGKG